MMLRFLISYFVFLVLFCPFSKAQNTDSVIVFNEEIEMLNIGKRVYYFEDKEGELTIEDIQKPEYQTQFKRSEQETLNFSITRSTIWVKLIVANQTDEKVYLEIAQALAWYIDFYKPNTQNKLVLTTQTGMMRPIKNREVDNNFFLFELFKSPSPKIYYFSIKSQTPIIIPLNITKKNVFWQKNSFNNWFFGIFTGFCLIMILYNLFIYFAVRQYTYIYYTLYLFSTLMLINFISGNYGYKFNIIAYKPQYIASFLGLNGVFISYFIISLLSLNKRDSLYKVLILFCTFNIGISIIDITIDFHIETGQISQLAIFFVSIYIILNTSLMYIKGNKKYRFIVFGFSFYMIGGVIHILHNLGLIGTNFFTLHVTVFGASIEILLFSFALADKINLMRQEKERSQRALLLKMQENEKLIKEQNIILEEKVHERTEELQVLNEELNSTVEELGLTLENLELQRETVETINRKMTASINYAQTIQQAVLPDKLILESYLQDYFLLYRPKDIVSGDFYWVAPIPKGYVVAVADCTGHGVAGSFMSLVGINLLGKMEDELETLSPTEMIRRLNIGVDKALKQDERQSYDEGMDIGIVRVEKEGNNYTLTFAGAKRPLYYISKEEKKIKEVRGERYSVGIGTQKEMFIQNHTLTLKTGDSFYLLSDGLADQNNEKRKRLGENILKETLQNLFDQESNTQLQQLEKLLDEHQGTAEQRDDITLLGVKLG